MARLELAEIANGLEHASQTLWRWASEQRESPWDRATCLRVATGLAEYGRDVRAMLAERAEQAA